MDARQRVCVATAVTLACAAMAGRSLGANELAGGRPASSASEAMSASRPPPMDEFRGMWVTRFEWPEPDQGQAKETIDTIMADLAAHHFNAVIFQVRGQADTFYPSPDESWSPLISPTGADPGWDPL